MPLLFRITSVHPDLPKLAQSKEFVACGGTIGRHRHNDWVLADQLRFVSGQHALIDFQAGAYYLIDTSRNGVYINNSSKPVGRGHPQRLFDGDQIRIGDFEIAITVTPDDPALIDDGMRDSVVRAQLVPEDDSENIALVDDSQLTEDEEAFATQMYIADSSPPTAPPARPAKRASLAGQAQSSTTDKSAAAKLLLDAAGLQSKDLAGVDPEDILETAGYLLNSLVTGIIDLIHERAKMKESFRLPQTMIHGQQNNPLKFSPGTNDALKFLLGDRSESYLSATEAVKAAVEDLKQHQRAVPTALFQALGEFIEQFDPEELTLRFDQGRKEGSLLRGASRPRYWEQYKECFEALIRSDDGRIPNAFSDEFARAYQQATERPKTPHKH